MAEHLEAILSSQKSEQTKYRPASTKEATGKEPKPLLEKEYELILYPSLYVFS